MIQRIYFSVGGDPVVGDLHLPDLGATGSAVVVAGPMTSVKEQVTGIYAAALAARGIAALAIDHRTYGQSGGAPKNYENWRWKVEDLAGALDALAVAAPSIDPNRLGAAAICLGCGYAATLAASDERVRSLGLVAGCYRDPTSMRANDPEGFEARVAQGKQARAHYENTGEVLTIPAAALDGDAAMQTADTVDYYTRRAAVPNYRNAFAMMSREHFLPFDVQAAAPRIHVPVDMVHSEKALSPHWAKAFHQALQGPKSLHWLNSLGQTDFYDDPELVSASADHLAKHFRATL
ncbi:alpha/beta hydrolase [Aquidulcibacter sp.]|uniref:alpha/beta hydrolase n=1 Tax=Aquidulcibacter sp. TaxID=2052990 RepID=UPI0025C3516F|nr:alpha/beta hydrolase [Aquidulcibacter sp.]